MKTAERLFREACKSAESDLRRRRNEIGEIPRTKQLPIPAALARDVAVIRRWGKVVAAAESRIARAGYRLDPEENALMYGYHKINQLQAAAHKPINIAMQAIPALRQKYAMEFFSADPSTHAAILRRAMIELAGLRGA